MSCQLVLIDAVMTAKNAGITRNFSACYISPMSLRSLTFCSIFLAGSVTPSNVYALEIGASADLMYFNYEEFDTTGTSLNSETGFLPGLTLSASQPYKAIHNTVKFSIYGGQVDYNGQTQSGQPHQTNTDESIYRILYKISWSPENYQSIFYARTYWQQWDRNILSNKGVSGLFERYQWWSLEAGIQASIYKHDRHDVLFELGLLKTTNGTIKIDLNNSGYGTPVLDLGDSIGLNSALNYQIKLRQNSDLQFGFRYTTWRFGRSNTRTLSNGSTVITVVEPESITHQVTATINYIHKF